ncbi:MAG: hypothetical protein AB2A00_01885 [Myxococcota bacterium]
MLLELPPEEELELLAELELVTLEETPPLEVLEEALDTADDGTAPDEDDDPVEASASSANGTQPPSTQRASPPHSGESAHCVRHTDCTHTYPERQSSPVSHA